MRYLPHTDAEVAAMLSAIGVSSIDDLFTPIPEAVRRKTPLDLEPALDEPGLMAHLSQLANQNDGARALSFLGAGMYDHHIPPAVDQLLLRSEFYTAYTPYQAEVSQGTLQAVFEFQTTVAELLALDVANASLYDGASAAAEAVLMARRIQKKRPRTLLSLGLHPEYAGCIRSYLHGLDDGRSTIDEIPIGPEGRTDLAALRTKASEETSAIIVGYPNFLGCVEDLESLRRIANDCGALLITATPEPYALSLIKPPGAYGVDIAVGEGQALAVPPQFGGPGVGLFACRNQHLRQVPGRLVGETIDEAGVRGFVLTLSTREQHIRRERATSNICTNHGLIALSFVIRTSMLGRRGFEHAGRLCLARSEYLKDQIRRTGRFEIPYAAPTFNEFVVRCARGSATEVVDRLAKQGIIAGHLLGRYSPQWERDFLVAVTEKHDRAALDRLVESL